MDEELTTGEKQAVADYIDATSPTPMPEEKYNVHLFLNKVATSDDTIKVGNLTTEELGTLKHPVRAIKEFELIARKIIGNDYIADYMRDEAEIYTSTSLSKEGFLVKQATTQTRNIADTTRRGDRPRRKGLFAKKEDPNQAENAN